MSEQKRWLAFYLLCAGELMIVLDTTIVNVALPSIQADLRFSDTALVWVVNAYMVTYGEALTGGYQLAFAAGAAFAALAALLGFFLFSTASENSAPVVDSTGAGSS